jgi:heme O synthase-like polyprenyltransferase
MNRNYAILLGALLGFIGLEELYRKYGRETALVGLSIFAGYLLIYTPMKRMSPLNTFVGAVIGALPVYLGWVATGQDVFAI